MKRRKGNVIVIDSKIVKSNKRESEKLSAEKNYINQTE